MDSDSLFLLAADSLLFVHVIFAAFIVLGLILVLLGKQFRWSWVRNPWFRILHLLATGIVAVQSWLGVICPLTIWEMALRERAGDAVYRGFFITHWLESILYYQAPQWVFMACYTVFGAMIIASWFWVRPRKFTRL